MSNVIPIVSSSPPPLDDDAGFGWDDDDEFGNFTSAPNLPAAKTEFNDSSFEVNWSHSELSGSPEEKFNEISTQNNGSDRDLNNQEQTSNSVIANDVSYNSKHIGFLPSASVKTESLNDDVTQDGGFSNFAHFENVTFAENIIESVNDNSQLNPDLQQNPPLLITPDVASCEVISGTDDDDGFQDFAQFTDNVVSEENPPSPSEISAEISSSDLQQEQMETCINKAPQHSSEKNGGSTLDQSPECTVTDSESSTSAVLKNNESLYSTCSTVDSGVFSADLSPSSQPGNLPDHFHHAEYDKVTVVETNTFLANIPSSNTAFSSSQKLEPTEETGTAQDVEEVHSTDIILNDNSTDKSDISGHECHVNSVSSSDHVDTENWSDFNTAIDVDSITSCSEQEHAEKSVHNEREYETGVTSASSEGSDEHSSNVQAHQVPNDSISPEPNRCSPQMEDSPYADVENTKREESSGEHEIEPKSADENEDEEEWGDFDNFNTDKQNIGDLDKPAVDRAKDHYISGGTNTSQSNLNHLQEETYSSESQSARVTSSNNDKINVEENSLETATVFRTNGQLDSENAACEECAQTAPQEATTLEAHLEPDDTEDESDTEFGDFGSYRDRKESDPQEVAPITFRSSLCEEETDGNTDDLDFSFHQERPAAFDEGNESCEFGAVGTASQEEDKEFEGSIEKVAENPVVTEDGKADEFGDFGSSEQTEAGESDWADFGSAPAVGEETDDFTDSQPILASDFNESNQSKVHKMEQAIVSCFPETTGVSIVVTESDKTKDQESDKAKDLEDDHFLAGLQNDVSLSALGTVIELGLSNALEAKQQTWTVVQHPSKKDPKVRLWGHLKDVDSCHALMYGWPSSYCSKEVFDTLHIDTQNVLFTQKKQAVPFFASGLSILEPIRGQDGKKEKNSLPPLQPTLLGTSRQEIPQNSTAQDIPPVDFDWSSSGLTNPLTANTLDLDFLVVQGSDTYEKTSVFKADCQDTTRSSLQPLEEILKKSTPTAKLATHEVLSPEALRILDKMPDLSFMQSRVLMFPVKQ